MSATQATDYDILIRGGRVIDPAQEIDAALDVGIRDGRIAAIGPSLLAERARQVIDAHGLLVTPGLIDLHTHVYEHVTPLSINADALAARSGTTTMVDAGSSGAATFAGLRKFVVEPSRCRILALLNVSVIGLAAMPECGYGRFVDPTRTAQVVEANRDVIVGIKVRGSRNAFGEGNGDQPVWHARSAGIAAGVPTMLHLGDPPPTVEQALSILGAGDVVTHCYKGQPVTRLVDHRGRAKPVLVEARERGVRLDVGHGSGSFSWEVARRLCDQGFWPDTISTDVHHQSIVGPVYDMPTTMSKLLHLGMPLTEVVRASTINAAKAIGWDDRIGSLRVGAIADVAVLALEEGSFALTDSYRQTETARQRLAARHTIRGGRLLQVSGSF